MGDVPLKGTAIDVDEVLSKLTLSEKIGLLSGIDFWHTKPIARLNVPSIRLSDGPNGIRGTKFFNSVQSACFPCGTAMGATWDARLMLAAGELMAEECRAKGAHVILGPAVNIQRSPLGGRGFESYSEDPLLSGILAAELVRGIQSHGVVAAIKHFVCNDMEHERMGVNTIVTERALREIYLKPFEIVQRLAKPRALMTAYNKVNGIHVSESQRMITDILRNEWRFDGLVMSDWFGTYSTVEAIKAGLDLEMPGPAKFRGDQLRIALNSHKIHEGHLDRRVRNVLNLAKRASDSGIPGNAPESTANIAQTSAFLRNIAASSIVLLKNEEKILPFGKEKSIAIIGPNAKCAAYCGGGSASLRPYYTVAPFDAVKAQAGDVRYALGATARKTLPQIGPLLHAKDGRPGFSFKFYLHPPDEKNRELVDELHLDNTNIFLIDYKNPKIKSNLFFADIEGTLVPDDSGIWDIGLTVCGTAQLFIDGQLVVDNKTKQRRGESFFGSGTTEETGSARLEAGRKYNLLVRFGSSATASYKPTLGAAPVPSGGVIIGGAKRTNPEEELAKALTLAKEVDQVIICAGLNSEFESEGFDRPHMNMPAGLDTLISNVAKANSNTAVVIQSGTPITMPWIHDVKAVLQAWYGGNECGNAIADVIFGTHNPSAKLPVSMPIRCEDNPAFLTFRSDSGRVLYGEDVFVGYRFYEKVSRPVLFPFGHGLSYTTFEMNNLRTAAKENTDKLTVSVDVRNTGKREGEEVVQVYISQRSPSASRPLKELKGFAKVKLRPGEKKSSEIELPLHQSVSFWNELRETWVMEEGAYTVLVGNSSANTPLRSDFTLGKILRQRKEELLSLL